MRLNAEKLTRNTIPPMLGCITVLVWTLPVWADSEIRFNRDIRPILSDNCFHCHGPDNNTRKAGLRLDREEGLFKAGKHGSAVVKGDLTASPLYQRITSTDEDEVMPPPDSHKELKPQQKELLKKWIEAGAPWEGHWALIAPQRPAQPSVKNQQWVRNAVDAFVLARMELAGLAPAVEADRHTLIRRLAFDLTGLPPDVKDVEEFVADTSPDAYEKVVDHYLASPRYGEHRARYWLDAARYADTHGLHFDNYREIWPYRDWVIKAFNSNMPFDQFTTDQLAGDLLPNHTRDQHVATGFIRAGMTTNEGGTIAEENLVIYARDRTETLSRVWLGLTLNCCVCHDHKFDPFTMRDFYSLTSFLNNGTMNALDGNIKDSPPAIVIPRPEDDARWAVVNRKSDDIRKAQEARRQAARLEFAKWLPTATTETFATVAPISGQKLSIPLNEGKGETVAAQVDGLDRQLALNATAKWQPGYVSTSSVQANGAAPVSVPDAGDFDTNEPFTVSVWAKLPGKVTGAILSRMDDSDRNYRGWDLWVENDRIGTHIINHWDDSAIKIVSAKPISQPTKWHHFCLTYDGSSKASGVKVYVDGNQQAIRPGKDQLVGTIRTKVPLKLGQRNNFSAIKGLLLEDVRTYNRALMPREVMQLGKSNRVAGIIAKAPAKRTGAENNELYEWYLGNLDAPSMELNSQLAGLEQEASQIRSRGAETLVVEEKPTPGVAYVLFRGEYDKRKDEVHPDTPLVLPPMPADAPRNRLGLAQWLMRPENPLVSRVIVNRMWQEIFGTGLVKSAEDFGVSGESPSHPELLDWLAVEFRESGWNVKRTFKLMVMSNAYRQAAMVTPDKLELDPANRLLSRGPRFRLDAETIRDNALAVSGLLVDKIGGASVRPYQPPGIWETVGMPESNTRQYKQDTGESLYRRSLYTFWKRAAPPASLEIFNAPSRESCVVRRERTNTPLQALVTLNDTQFVEAARALAQLAIGSASTTDARLDLISRRVLSRPFRPAESAVAESALNDLLAYYGAHADDATKLLSIGDSKRDESINPGEHAAWTLLVNQVMNLDEALNK